MAQILVRELADDVVVRLKERARRNNRSLQGEVKAVLEREAERMSGDEMRATIDAWHTRWRMEDRRFSDSTKIVRELRDER